MPRSFSPSFSVLGWSRARHAAFVVLALAGITTVPDEAAANGLAPSEQRQAQRRRGRRRRPTSTEPSPPPVDTEVAGAPSSTAPTSTTSMAAPEPTETPVEAPAPTRPIALDAFVAFRGMGRSLSFNNDSSGMFRGYDLAFGPSIYASVEWFPGAHFTSNALAHIGIYGDFGAAFGIVSQDNAGTSFNTGSILYDVGLRGRFPVVQHLDLGLRIGYGSQTYAISSAMGAPPGLPDVAYQFIRFGLSGRYDIAERVGILIGLNYLLTFTAGQFTTGFFPHESINGLEGNIALAVRVIAGLEVRVGFDARVFLHSFSANDMYAVGSASDLFYGVTLGAAYRF